jgi:hypothetical protein
MPDNTPPDKPADFNLTPENMAELWDPEDAGPRQGAANVGKNAIDHPGYWQINDVPIRSAGDGSFPERLNPNTGQWETLYGLAELMFADRITPEECKRLERRIMAALGISSSPP